MAASPEIADMVVLTHKYYTRLRELLSVAPDDCLSARAGAEGLTVAESVHHVCQCDLWYINGIDGGSRTLADREPSKQGLLDQLNEAEAAMADFLEGLTPEMLQARREVPAWWAAGAERSARLVLMHSLAHKYYHCGQLQSILHTLATDT